MGKKKVFECLKNYYSENNNFEAGLDEAGRGCLFGPVYTACVIWNKNISHPDIQDSKKLTKKRREAVVEFIKENAIAYAIDFADAHEIDEYNILQANMNSMHRAIKAISKIRVPDMLLVDGSYFRYYEGIPHKLIEKGDSKYTSIAAASILAKTARDEYIEKLCKEKEWLNERYGLISNKGYGTIKHRQGLEKYGKTNWHRLSFSCKKLESKEGSDKLLK
jgi:ribonuclease HII